MVRMVAPMSRMGARQCRAAELVVEEVVRGGAEHQAEQKGAQFPQIVERPPGATGLLR